MKGKEMTGRLQIGNSKYMFTGTDEGKLAVEVYWMRI